MKQNRMSLNKWFPLVMGLFITFTVTFLVHLQNQHELRVYTQELVSDAKEFISERFESYEYGLAAARGAILATGADKINRKQFEQYINSRNLKTEFPGALGFGYILRVTKEEEARFISEAKKDGAPDFKVRFLNQHDQDRFIIKYVYPKAENAQAVGLDIGSEKNRRSAALASAAENRAYLTQPITLVQADKKTRRGVLILLPVFKNGEIPRSPDLRRDKVYGWSYAVLVVDDVLADVPKSLKDASIKLTNAAENSPFYSYTNTLSQPISEGKITTDINVLGQRWTLETTPHDAALAEINHWPLLWIILPGLFLSLILNHAFGLLNIERDTLETEDYLLSDSSFENFRLYWKSQTFRKSLLPACSTTLLIILVSIWQIYQSHMHKVQDELTISVRQAQKILSTEIDRYSSDLFFLKNSPLFSKLEAIDKVDESAKLDIKNQLASVFQAYMRANEDIHQVRFLRPEENWKEIVKVERVGEKLTVFNKLSLQEKAAEPYIQNTLQIAPNDVYISEINLNREHGSIAYPDQPVWRFSTAKTNSSGQTFGILIININAKQLLYKIREGRVSDTHIYLTNSDGKFILHPEDDVAFSFERGLNRGWTDDFNLMNTSEDESGLLSYKSFSGEAWVKRAAINIGATTAGRSISIYATKLKQPVLKSILTQAFWLIALLLTLNILFYAFHYSSWLNLRNSQREKWLQKDQEQKALEMRRIKSLLDSAPDAMLITDSNGVIQQANIQALQIFGYSRTQLEGHSIDLLIPEKAKTIHKQHVVNYLKDQKFRPMGENKALAGVHSDGTEFPIEVSIGTVQFENETLISASIRPIGDRLAIEAKLKDALEHAEKATEAKTAFLANTSHEIRTPLNAIIGLTRLLRDEELTSSQEQLINKIEISGKTLLGIVNDVLDLSKIEASEMELESVPLDLRELLDEISTVFSIQAHAKQLDFEVTIDPKIPYRVVSDSTRIRQILVNLLGNAMKFTDIGSIKVSAKVLETRESEGNEIAVIELDVIDTGVGISEGAMTRLFKPFAQADSSTTRKYGGTGLGLSIVHKLVELFGGSVGVEAGNPTGSRFWVKLPMQVLSSDQAVALDSSSSALFVMIAEDNTSDAERLEKLTDALGWRSQVTHDGASLIKAFSERHEQKLKLPDAIIIDWQMPVIDGVSALKLLSDKVGRENLPAILLVSSYDEEKLTELDKDNFVDTVLKKPVNASTLFNAVNEVVSKQTGNHDRVLEATKTEAVNAQWLHGTKILVVDDNDINLEVASHILRKNGAEVVCANSGERSLEILKDESELFDAVLMDVQMPGIDGLATTVLIRSDLQLKDLPVIALTAGALNEEKRLALQAGMNDFITKPIAPAQLINTIRKGIRAYRGKEPDIVSHEKNAQKTDDWPSIERLNPEEAKKLLMGDKELFFKTLSRLLNDNSNLLSPVTEDIDKPESLNLRLGLAGQIHKLRSNAGMIGAIELYQFASQCENNLRSRDIQPVRTLLEKIRQELQCIKDSSKGPLKNWFKNTYRPDSEDINDAEPISEKDKEYLKSLLAEQDLDILEEVETFAPSLKATLGQSSYNKFTNSLETLDFEEALNILEAS